MIHIDTILKKLYTQLFLLLVVVFLIHIGILNFLGLPLFENKIILSYVINFLLAAIIFTAIYRLKETQKDNLGFLFIGGSFIKFLVFFLLFYPFFKLDGNIDKLEFSSFFVPYIVCLVIETTSLSKFLNKLYQNKQ
ncbi:MAG: hypothetical protein ACI8QP_001227 [Porticoccaceae bacterium]